MKAMEVDGVCCSTECNQQLATLGNKIDNFLVRLSKLRRELMNGSCDTSDLTAIINEGRPILENCTTMIRVADGLLKAAQTTTGASSSKASSKNGSVKKGKGGKQ